MMPCIALLLLALGFPESRAQAPETENMPAVVALMLSPTHEGMFVRMPAVDSDPNRGLTYGIMPILVQMKESTIRRIHAFSGTYNRYVGLTGKYQFFYFPSDKTDVQFRASSAQKYDREIVYEYNTASFLDGRTSFNARLEYSRDGSARFFGIGPNSSQDGESNYTLDTLNYRLTAGVPLSEGGPLAINFRHLFQANEVRPGAITSPEDLENKYPALGANLRRRHRDASVRTFLTYDTRDNSITSSRGTLSTLFLDGAREGVLGQYSYIRYGAGYRHFWPIQGKEDFEPRFITAARARLEQLKGGAPFWAQSQLGGKYSNRGYGDGRYIDHGMVILGAEQRCRIVAKRVSGLTASLWLDPFVEAGTVFRSPEAMQLKYFHPAAGVALRAVGRPQIVGSADFAYGQEGLKIFLDINYTY